MYNKKTEKFKIQSLFVKAKSLKFVSFNVQILKIKGSSNPAKNIYKCWLINFEFIVGCTANVIFYNKKAPS